MTHDETASMPAGSGPVWKDTEKYEDRWELAWGSGLKPGQLWDCRASSPALLDLLKRGTVDVKGKRVLVPGCGRGYDIPVFSSAGASEVVGLELSPSAAQEAQRYVQEQQQERNAGGAGVAGSARVVQGNFFEWADDSFDVGFDYTFCCAMHPTMRQDWARSWARHLGRPGSTLVGLVFPVDPAADPAGGPPFPLSVQLYRQLLEPHGFELVHEEPVPPELSHPPRGGKEIMTVWRKA